MSDQETTDFRQFVEHRFHQLEEGQTKLFGRLDANVSETTEIKVALAKILERLNSPRCVAHEARITVVEQEIKEISSRVARWGGGIAVLTFALSLLAGKVGAWIGWK